MTEIQLRARVFEDLNAILDNENAMRQLRAFLSQLRKEVAESSPAQRTEPYTTEEINARLDRAEADDEAGKLITHREVMQQAYKYLDAR